MKRYASKVISAYIAFVLILSSVSVTAFAVEIDEGNTFGTKGTYTDGLTFQKTINYSTKEIYYSVYSYRGTADEVVIPDYYNGYPVKEINSRVFDSANMRSIKLPNQLTEIGGYAFCDCTNLETIEFPDSMLTLYGASAFYGCTSLKEVKFGGYLTSISSQAFINCTSLEKIYLPDSVTTIGMSAFMNCTNLREVSGGKGLKSISSQAFNTCSSLESFIVGDNVESIGINAFSSCYNLKSITMGNSLKSIDSSAFASCTSLEELYFKSGLETIGGHAFNGCTSLKKLYIPSTVTLIKSYAFNNCDLLQDIYYAGTESEYSLIEINSDHNDALFNANIHYNYTTHTHSYTSKVTKQPTCTTAGVKTFTCSCGDGYTETIPATGHSFGDWTTTKTATCTTDGTQERKCSVCGQIETQTITATGHKYSSEWTIDKHPTCTEAGSKSHHCTVCGDKKDVTSIPATGHKYVTTVVKPTYASQGYTLHKCSVCGASYKDKYTAKRTVPSISKASFSTSANAVKISWSKVSGAKGYVVYKYNTSTKKWQKVGVTSGTSYTFSKLSSGTTYKFTVRAYATENGKNYYSPKFTTFTTSTNPATVKFTLTAGSKKATVKWSKVTGATGYKIYYKTSANGKWVGLKTVNNNTTSYTKTGLAKGKTYYFTVKAYRTVGGKTYNGTFVTKSVKVK